MALGSAPLGNILSETEQKQITELLSSLTPTLKSPEQRWAELLKNPIISESNLAFPVHLELYKKIYGPKAAAYLGPLWVPGESDKKRSRLYQWMIEKSLKTLREFHAWTAKDRENFWREAIDRLELRFEKRGAHTLRFDEASGNTEILKDSLFNIGVSCFQADPKKIAIIERREDGRARELSYGELESLSCLVALQLGRALDLKAQDKVAIFMPMTIESVLIYLGCVLAGVSVVSIADSFAPDEISTRLRISGAKVIFTQDRMMRASKEISLLDRALKSTAEKIVCVPLREKVNGEIRSSDMEWAAFLTAPQAAQKTEHSATSLAKPITHASSDFLNALAKTHPLKLSDIPVYKAPEDSALNILFSSGTTSDPKAIVWTQSTPIKCGVDAMLHQDLLPDDVCHWPTNLGWMMGPWLLWSTFLNRAILALYDGAPHTRAFAEFISAEKVTMLGTVPSLVKSWRAADVFKNLKLSVRCFSSTGECSSPEDMHWLSAQVGYRPIIEYCGGTEIGGAYISSTCVENNYASCFGTKAFGLDFVLLDSTFEETRLGEVFLVPPSIGLSNKLLNKSHFDTYFKDTPQIAKYPLLRRHGDELEFFAEIAQYRALGRSDDTMNLGGIKVSSAEIERCFQSIDEIKDCAAIAITPKGGGPSLLFVAVALGDSVLDLKMLKEKMQKNISAQLNPLFKIHELKVLDALPRTASNKVLRRVIRDQILNER